MKKLSTKAQNLKAEVLSKNQLLKVFGKRRSDNSGRACSVTCHDSEDNGLTLGEVTTSSRSAIDSVFKNVEDVARAMQLCRKLTLLSVTGPLNTIWI
ncbi:hypothetical protein [Pedobacter deserti]|uniref:hypothetical protein n=1 Tax=Pedobacter deserti TaxID=2817382 RepID=UPI00210EE55A|nr:hypothetical protein [Pedobacter sp. SYSU D00382]